MQVLEIIFLCVGLEIKAKAVGTLSKGWNIEPHL